MALGMHSHSLAWLLVGCGGFGLAQACGGDACTGPMGLCVEPPSAGGSGDEGGGAGQGGTTSTGGMHQSGSTAWTGGRVDRTGGAGGEPGDPEVGGAGGTSGAAGSGGTSGSGGEPVGPEIGGAGGTSGAAGGGGTSGSGGEPGGPEVGGGGSGGSGGVPPVCDCASSDALTLIACGGLGRPNANTYDFNGTPTALVTPDGQTIVFNTLEFGTFGSKTTARRWTPSGTTVAIEGAWASAMSADGRTLLYFDVPRGWTSALWNADSGATALPLDASLLSADGSVVVGMGEATIGEYEAVRWTAAQGLLPVSAESGVTLSALNADGSLAAGSLGTNQSSEAIRWTATGLTRLGALPTARRTWGAAEALSQDGVVVAGLTADAGDEAAIFRWTEALGMTKIVRAFYGFDLADSALRTLLSDDGSVLAGTVSAAGSPYQGRAFRWTAGTGATLLEPNGLSFVRSLSADGNVVLGSAYASGGGLAGAPIQGFSPFVWDAVHGKRDLGALLAASSVDLSGWSFGEPVALSRNGKVVVGLGTCNGVRALYRAALPE